METTNPFVQVAGEPEIELAPGVWARLIAGERGMLSFVSSASCFPRPAFS